MMPQPYILAFAFGSQLLLSGLALASIPLLIHLLHRKHFVETRWAAMRFLLQAHQKQSRRVRVEQLLLLLLRTLLIAIFVLALARPILDSSTSAISASQATHRILVVDASYSMQFRESELVEPEAESSRAVFETRFDKAKKQALDLVQQSQSGDLWNVLRVAQDGTESLPSPPSASADFAASEIRDLNVSDGTGDFASIIPALLKLARSAPEVPRKEIVVFSDMQASFWAALEDETNNGRRAAFEELQQAATLSLVNVASGSSSNIAITELKADRSFGLLDRPNRLVSTIRNSGTGVIKGRIVDLLVDDRLVETKRVDLPADMTVSLDWQVPIQSPGEHLIEVHVEDDQLPIDNHRRMVLPVRDELRVLVVDDGLSARSETLTSTSFYVARALAPQVDRKTGNSPIRPLQISANELAGTKLDQFDVIVISNGWAMTEREILAIEAVVRSGRGLIVFPSGGKSLELLNASLYRSGKGPLPASILGQERFRAEEGALRFELAGSEHSLIRDFQRNPGSGLEATLVFQWAKLAPTGDSRVALRFTTQDPAIIERQFGRGRVLLIATNPLAEWSTWGALGQSFVPLLHEAILYSASGTQSPAIEVGQTATIESQVARSRADSFLRTPDGSKRPLQIVETSGQEQVILERLDQAGAYRIEAATGDLPALTIAVNPTPAEGVLASASQPDSIQTRLAQRNLTQRDETATNPAQSSWPSQPASQLALRLAFAFTLTLLVTEPLFAATSVAGITQSSCAAGLVFVSIAMESAYLAAAAIVVVGLVCSARTRSSQRAPVSPAWLQSKK